MTATRVSLSFDAVRTALLKQATQANAVADALKSKNSQIDAATALENGAFKVSTLSLGTSPQVGSTPALVPPAFTSGEIKLDGLFNPYVIVNFSIPRSVVDGNKIVAFKVYRKKVLATQLNQNVTTFNKSDFEQISQGTTKTGKFSQDRKAQYSIDGNLQTQSNINQNLYDLQQTGNSQNQANGGGFSQFSDAGLTNTDQTFTLVATVNYASQQSAAQLKQVYVRNDTTVTAYYEDHNVTYGSAYTYCVTAYCKTGEESAQSATIAMVVLNLDGIEKPRSFSVHQLDASTIKIAAGFDPKDKIKQAYFFRRATTETKFNRIAIVENYRNSIAFTDKNIVYGSSYIYRIILENIFGAVSEPEEVSITCTTQNATNKTRSHNLLFPIMLVSQDENSDGIKITIYPNDRRVLYYQLNRRNISSNERRYGVPINKSREYWSNNKFFVQASTGSLITSETIETLLSGGLPPQTDFTTQSTPVVFVDKYVTVDNIYQYRATGYDKYGNSTASAFGLLKANRKNSLRAPVNLTSETLRDTPFRTRLRWDDDNQATLGSNDIDAEQRLLEINLKALNLSSDQQAAIENLLLDPNLQKIDIGQALALYNLKKEQLQAIQAQATALEQVNNSIRFQLQRRDLNQSTFSTFPSILNKFLIDEVACSDAVQFNAKGTEDTFNQLSSSYVSSSAGLQRPFNIPPYLSYDTTYEYRVAAIDSYGAASAYSPSIYVNTNAKLPIPENFSGSALNPNVSPSVVVLTWDINQFAVKPDYFRIEKKVDTPSDNFKVIGNSYIKNRFFDRDTELGKQYIYRIRSVSVKNVESSTTTVAVST